MIESNKELTNWILQNDVVVYASGLQYASICVPKDLSGDSINSSSDNWFISKDKEFVSGHPNPCPCELDPNRIHYLMELS